jgi:hypothetical protein
MALGRIRNFVVSRPVQQTWDLASMHDFDPSARDQDANALRVVLIYAAFAALWILLSDRLVAALFSDPAHILLASMLKGWLFVAITSLLLYGLIRGRARNAKVGAGGTPISRRGGFLLAALAILLLAGAGIGHSIERQREVQLTNLHSIAAAKSRQIAAWLTERRGDAELIRGSHYIAENFHSWLTGVRHRAEPENVYRSLFATPPLRRDQPDRRHERAPLAQRTRSGRAGTAVAGHNRQSRGHARGTVDTRIP